MLLAYALKAPPHGNCRCRSEYSTHARFRARFYFQRGFSAFTLLQLSGTYRSATVLGRQSDLHLQKVVASGLWSLSDPFLRGEGLADSQFSCGPKPSGREPRFQSPHPDSAKPLSIRHLVGSPRDSFGLRAFGDFGAHVLATGRLS